MQNTYDGDDIMINILPQKNAYNALISKQCWTKPEW